MAPSELGSRLSADTEPDHVGALILDFQPPDPRNTFLLFISYPDNGKILQPEMTTIIINL